MRTRLITEQDAPLLARLLTGSREFLAPWEPRRGEDWFTTEGQRIHIEAALELHRHGDALPCVVLDEAGEVAGRITLHVIVRGAFQSCSLGYWLARPATGRGLATAAVGEVTGVAFGELGLHRVQADTLVDNLPSQRVLERCGFVRFGTAPTYLQIDGRWQTCHLHQLIAPAPD